MSRVVAWGAQRHDLGPAVVAIGMFDGVHVGHAQLLRDTRALAESDGVASAVITFDRDPETVIRPDIPHPMLLDYEDRLEEIAANGPDLILVVRFVADVASMSPDGFLDTVLLGAFQPVRVVVGTDFRFGSRAAGDVRTLEAHGAAHGYAVTPQELVVAEGAPVTSTRIRRLVSEGEVARAGSMLGRPHRIHGRVVPGRGDGARLDVPTANLSVEPAAALPADGVYAARCVVRGDSLPAAVSVGTPPSVQGAEFTVEAHLLGLDDDLYGERLRLDFVRRLRPLRSFPGLDELAEALRQDIAQVRRLLAE